MPQIVTFIGWHNSGKTTLATHVVKHLKESGYRVAVIKSSKETGLTFDKPGTDTDKHRQAGADSILFVAPDQMVLMTRNNHLSLTALALRYFPDVDIVIGEGFKTADNVAKIEVIRDAGELLRNKVTGVIAVATDQNIAGDYIFQLNESRAIASFIEKRFLLDAGKKEENVSLLVNGAPISLKEFEQDTLTETVSNFVQSLNVSDDAQEIELRIKLKRP
ncbi:MAG: molybdopterin-guanine dinucleotide biosynthesis protein B [Proteobacteria bacterium]|nr:molybdopterin-guanine dinucleotide biosynthesis protein B [Pseudomonadota bacterium]MBU4297482.1 molybdopterin-guanine dinucleotide biosynthesis protein B [Pseudomonadota bacterium]MCG2749252.1 molybdopterin-guanine dinucleotide biosynthesis protein B [Desulfobulbaceae bacterium]